MDLKVIDKIMESKKREETHKCDGGDDYGLVDCKKCEEEMLKHFNNSKQE